MITFPKRFLNIFKHTSTDDFRPAMNCVKLNSDGKGHFTLLATNGHILTQLQYDGSQKEKEPISGLIPAKLFQQSQSIRVKSEKKNPLPDFTLSKEKDSFHLSTPYGLLEAKAQAVNEIFPNWESLIPAEKPQFEIGFNVRLLINALEVIAEVGEKEYDGFHSARIQFFGDKKAIIIKTGNVSSETRTVTMVMPIIMRDDSCNSTFETEGK